MGNKNPEIYFVRINVLDLFRHFSSIPPEKRGDEIMSIANALLLCSRNENAFADKLISESEEFSRKKSTAGKKGMESRWKVNKEDAPQSPMITHKFVPPTPEEVRDECARRGMQDVSEAFCGFYESNGWRVGKNPMKSWKGALTTWQHREVVRKSSPPRYESESARTSRINNEFMSRKNAGESSESIAADFEKRKSAGTL